MEMTTGAQLDDLSHRLHRSRRHEMDKIILGVVFTQCGKIEGHSLQTTRSRFKDAVAERFQHRSRHVCSSLITSLSKYRPKLCGRNIEQQLQASLDTARHSLTQELSDPSGFRFPAHNHCPADMLRKKLQNTQEVAKPFAFIKTPHPHQWGDPVVPRGRRWPIACKRFCVKEILLNRQL